MKARLACMALALLLAGSAAAAQSVAALLQKGIYAHETVGDLDAAIRLYEQVIASAPAGSDLAAQAQRRLVAARAQRKWVAQNPIRGTFDGRTYRHTWTGTTFEVPDGWKYSQTGMSSDDGEMAFFSAGGNEESVNVWMKKDETAPDKLAARLEHAPVEKAGQRVGYTGWRIRDGSVERVTIGGQPALLAIADYAVDSGQPMVEYLAWIYTEKNRVFFFSRMPLQDLAHLKPQLDAMVQSAVVQ
jgi:hypothetical protein